MSCVLFWCCGGRQSNADREDNVKKGEANKGGGKFKRMKMWLTSKMKRPVKMENERLEKAAAEAEAEAIQNLMNVLLDESAEIVENHLGGDETTEATLTEAEAEAIEYLMLVINNIEAELLGKK
ncbi:hypothetical protein AOLI_G00038970 [Acnodon oligacanthus]